jgi:putative membrane protein
MADLEDSKFLFAAEGTLLSWNRNSLSMIGFGFVVERAGVLITHGAVHAALTFLLGVAFTALGAFTAAYSALQYHAVLRTLTSDRIPPGYASRWRPVANWLVAALGAGTTVVLLVGRAA